jgi:glycosyltransferase involved in cell wall biosynthesis
MLQNLNRRPLRILMTLDAVGGVWRYAIDLAHALALDGNIMVLAGLGPRPSEQQLGEAAAVGTFEWLDTPPDWMTDDETDLDTLPTELSALVRKHEIDLIHLNSPSQACGLEVEQPVIAMSHSCVATWFKAVRNEALPEQWRWQARCNRAGFDRADMVLAPSRSHAAMLESVYGPIDRLTVVHNGGRIGGSEYAKEPFAFAAARWWDEGKNGRVLDEAAAALGWPVVMAGPVFGPNGQWIELRHADQLGQQSAAETNALMARAAVFVSPSLYEPFGLAALEAAQAQTPLVLADIPTYRELWDDAALFFPARDAEALAAAIDRLMRDQGLRERLGRAAADRARAYSLDRQAARMLAIYHEAAAPALAGR